LRYEEEERHPWRKSRRRTRVGRKNSSILVKGGAGRSRLHYGGQMNIQQMQIADLIGSAMIDALHRSPTYSIFEDEFVFFEQLDNYTDVPTVMAAMLWVMELMGE
jgi:hypothetical protein